jgi:hypothetical protein
VKDPNPNVHVKVFKVAIQTKNETNDAKIVNLFSFTLSDTMYNWCNNYMGNYPNYKKNGNILQEIIEVNQ